MIDFRSPRAQSGLSLVELLVALALSLFLVAGIVTLYTSFRQGYEVQKQSMALQKKERLASNFVATIVQSSGYYAQPQTYSPVTAFPSNSTFGTAEAIYGTSSSQSGNYADTLSLRFLTAPGDNAVDCLGQQNTGSSVQLYVNTFSLDTAKDELMCTVSGPGLTAQTHALVTGVTSLHFLYGLDTDGDGSANVYVPASNLSQDQWGSVRSVEMVAKFLTRQTTTGLPGNNPSPTTFEAVFPLRTNLQ